LDLGRFCERIKKESDEESRPCGNGTGEGGAMVLEGRLMKKRGGAANGHAWN